MGRTKKGLTADNTDEEALSDQQSASKTFSPKDAEENGLQWTNADERGSEGKNSPLIALIFTDQKVQ